MILMLLVVLAITLFGSPVKLASGGDEDKPIEKAPIEKQPKDPGLLEELAKQNIDSEYVELIKDYSKGNSYSRVYKDKKGDLHFALISQLAMADADGNLVEVGFDKDDKKYKTKNNLFHMTVDGTEVTVKAKNDQPWGAKKGDKLVWDPQLFIGGNEIRGPPDATLLTTDPYNENYTSNVLRWDYGVCIREIRIIEGMIREWWIFNTAPEDTVEIKHNTSGETQLKIGTAIDSNSNLLDVTIVGDSEVVNASEFAREDINYPVRVGGSATYYPDAAAADASVREVQAGGVNWATIIAAAGTSAVDLADYFPVFIENHGGGGDSWTYNVRGIYCFNTAALPDDCAVTAATLSIYGTAKLDNLSTSPDINIYSSNPGDVTAIAAGDYDSLGSTAYCDTTITYASWNTTGYNDFIFNSTGLAAVSKTGVSTFGAREVTHDVGAVTPNIVAGVNSYLKGYFTEQGAGFKPRLVVTYVVFPTLTTQAASSIARTSAILNGNITNTGGENCDYRGFVWDTSTHADPGNTAPGASAYSDNWTEAGSFSTGAFTHTPTLTQSTTYYYRSCAHNTAGWAYGGEESFTTLGHPLLTTVAATLIRETTATLNGNITYAGGVNVDTRGYVWDTASQGDPGNSAPGASGYANNWTEAGTFGTGTYTRNVTGLTGGQTYYFRSCAQNTYDWNYGTELSFTTLELVCHFDFEIYLISSTIDDQSTKNNDGIATFRTTSSDADVSANVSIMLPISEAAASSWSIEEGGDMIASAPTEISQMYTELNVNHLPGADFITDALTAADVPDELFWFPACFGAALILGFIAFAVTRSLFIQAIVSGMVMGFCAAMTGGGIIPFWTVIVFIIEALAVLVSRKQVSW